MNETTPHGRASIPHGRSITVEDMIVLGKLAQRFPKERTGVVLPVVLALMTMRNEDLLCVLRCFCRDCGDTTESGPCHCTNDE